MGHSLPGPGAVLELEIAGLNHEGQGVARLADAAVGGSGPPLVVFVPEALPGERITARVRRRARRHLWPS